jgi:hypothetical protein
MYSAKAVDQTKAITLFRSVPRALRNATRARGTSSGARSAVRWDLVSSSRKGWGFTPTEVP